MLATDQEKLVPVFDPAVTGKRLDCGGFDNPPANVRFLYAAMFTGAAAEISDASVKAILQT
jgi:hypothetical protein